jgi:hypothetical protein
VTFIEGRNALGAPGLAGPHEDSYAMTTAGRSETAAEGYEKVPSLKALGVTAVELLPVHEFDELDCRFVNPLTGERLKDFGATTRSPSECQRRPTRAIRRGRPPRTSSAGWSGRSTPRGSR